jgi:hypothetical protein
VLWLWQLHTPVSVSVVVVVSVQARRLLPVVFTYIAGKGNGTAVTPVAPVASPALPAASTSTSDTGSDVGATGVAAAGVVQFRRCLDLSTVRSARSLGRLAASIAGAPCRVRLYDRAGTCVVDVQSRPKPAGVCAGGGGSVGGDGDVHDWLAACRVAHKAVVHVSAA